MSFSIDAVLVGGLLWFLVVGMVQTMIRTSRGLPVFMPEYRGTMQSESWTSSGRFGSVMAKRCAWVVQTDRCLYLGLHFPFSVIFPSFLARWLGCEGTIVLESITSVSENARPLCRPTVVVSWRSQSGSVDTVEFEVTSNSFAATLAEAARDRGASVSVN